ncbi:hypothetical protein ILYODFUR_005967 [Ilyodon furcidens]|uniref:Secreted protein n=1 Tax=Ilyodon furcidens TaxID=33524 RepID=A0ABV0SKJ0_9TELE
MQIKDLHVLLCWSVCVCVCVVGGCALRRSLLSGGLTGRRAALVRALIDAVCCPRMEVCVSLAGSSQESRDPPPPTTLYSLPRDTQRSQHLDQTHTVTHSHTQSLSRFPCRSPTHSMHTE